MVKSGIYRIINTGNNKCYIGSSSDLRKRKSQHFRNLNKGTHHNQHLQNSFNKNSNIFSFQILIRCDNEDLIFWEQHFIDKHNPEYNISPTAGSSLGIVRDKEYCLKKREFMLGRKLSDEVRQTMSEKNARYWAGKKRSNSTIAKIRATRIKKPIVREDGKEFSSVSEAAESVNGNISLISLACKVDSRLKTYKGFKWKYKKV